MKGKRKWPVISVVLEQSNLVGVLFLEKKHVQSICLSCSSIPRKFTEPIKK